MLKNQYQKLAKFNKANKSFKTSFFTIKARQASILLRQAFIKILIFHFFNPKFCI